MMDASDSFGQEDKGGRGWGIWIRGIRARADRS